MSWLTKVLLVIAAIVVAGGVVYLTRPEPQRSTLNVATPTPSPVDNTLKFPPEPSPVANLTPIQGTADVTLKTSQGDIKLTLDGAAAPITVGNFVKLAQENFYDGTTFHRVIPDFMVQGGDPLSKDQAQRAQHGTGGPAYRFKDEVNARPMVRGSLAMANAGPNTNGSQFFIVTGEAFPHLQGKHTNFGQVTEGMDIVDAISKVDADEADNPITPIVITDVLVGPLPSPPLHVE